MCKKLIFLLPLMLFVFSCSESDVVNVSGLYSTNDSGDLRRRTSRRSSGSSRSSSSEPCKDSRSCVEICDDIFLKASALDDCYNEKEDIVQDMADVFDELINPKKLSRLNDIDEDAFSDFLSLSPTGFLDLIDPLERHSDRKKRDDDWEDLYIYDAINARLVLEWLANEEEFASILKSKDKNNDIIRALLQAGGSDLHRKRTRYATPGGKQPLCIKGGTPDRHTHVHDNNDDDPHHNVNPVFGNHPHTHTSADDHYHGSPHPHPSAWDEEDLNMILGFSDNAYDDISILSYSYALDNDPMMTMLESVYGGGYCPSEINGENINQAACSLYYLCLARVYEGRDYYVEAKLDDDKIVCKTNSIKESADTSCKL